MHICRICDNFSTYLFLLRVNVRFDDNLMVFWRIGCKPFDKRLLYMIVIVCYIHYVDIFMI